jgi:aromatic-amino-acid transaminase
VNAATDVGTRDSFLIPECVARPGDDPIFTLNAEAAKRAAAGESILNATLGSLVEDDGKVAVMPTVAQAIAAVPPDRAAAYAPIAGEPRYLQAVIKDLYGDGLLAGQSVAVATPGGTGAVHNAIVNFLDVGDTLLSTDYYWGPYKTLSHHTRRKFETFRMFDERGAFDAASFEEVLLATVDRQGRALIALNTPCNNPTGYTLDEDDWTGLVAALKRGAKLGSVGLCIDLAYARFGTLPPTHWVPFAEELVGEVMLMVAWTASKTFAQYGARIGALVASHPDPAERERVFNALSYSCRGTWSNCNHQGMLAITELLEHPELGARVDAERGRLIELLDSRVEAFNRIAKQAGLDYPRYEGGFFVTVFTPDPGRTAAVMREQGVYVVPLDRGAVRVALCATPVVDVPRLVEALVAGVAAACG